MFVLLFCVCVNLLYIFELTSLFFKYINPLLMLEKHGWGEVVSITFSVCKSPSWTGKGISGLSLLKSEGQLRHAVKKRYGRN